jgi:hypothetical protein
MKAYGEWMYRSTFSLNSTLVVGEWLASLRGRFTARETAPGTHWIGGWVNPSPVWTSCRSVNFLPHRDSNPDPSVVQPVASHNLDSAIRGPEFFFYFFFICIVGAGFRTGSTRHVGHFWPIVPALDVCGDGEFGGIKIGRGNRRTRRKPDALPFCLPQIGIGPP